jgi:hypothetical protein
MNEAQKTCGQKVLIKLTKHSSFDLNSIRDAELDAKKNSETDDFKEGGIGWLILFTTVWSYGIIIGMQNNFSIIYLDLLKVYNSTEHSVMYSGKW